MNKFAVLVVVLIFFSSCKTEQKKDPVITKIEPQNKVELVQVKVGWVDEDTYTVKITAIDKIQAVKKAKLKILKDIVKTRTLSNSPYLNVSKINEEFDKPLENGKIIREKPVEGGVEIHFQIKHEGLKKMFRRG